MHYRSYSTEDFINDEFFRQWVLSPDAEKDRYWTEYLLQHPSQQPVVDAARAIVLAMDFPVDVAEPVIQEIKFRFNAAIDRHEAEVAENRQAIPLETTTSGPGRRLFYLAAASLLLLALAVGYVLNGRVGSFELLRAIAFREESTLKGEQRHMVLEDGTEVWLNSGSTLQFARNLSREGTREVHLNGEAFFEVAEDKSRPFIVHTSNLAIQVLGTAFNVRSYPGDEIVETTLVRGKVSIVPGEEKDSARHITLLPNQKALFRKDSQTMSLESAINTDSYIAWKDGWMIFEDKPFSYIRETLERWYNVTIVIEDESSLACTFSAKFKQKTLEEVLEIFKNTEAINYRIEGSRVFIDGRFCNYENIN